MPTCLSTFSKMSLPPTDLFSVDGRIVVVTGGLGQLGRQYSLDMVSRGARVAIFDQAAPDKNFGENALTIPVDVRRRDSLEEGLDEIRRTWGVPHALVNNAAIDAPPDAPSEENGPFETYPESSWDKVMEVNAKGVFLCCQVIGGLWPKPGGDRWSTSVPPMDSCLRTRGSTSTVARGPAVLQAGGLFRLQVRPRQPDALPRHLLGSPGGACQYTDPGRGLQPSGRGFLERLLRAGSPGPHGPGRRIQRRHPLPGE